MKIPNLRKKIIINFSTSFVLLSFFTAIIAYYVSEKNAVGGKINKIKNETSKIKNQTSEIENKAIETKKYKELWKRMSVNKKNVSGIKMDDVNSKLLTFAAKYAISGQNIKISIPETLKDGIFKTTTASVLFTTVNLTFSAPNDIKALLFMDDFFSSLQGYQIITSAELKKNKEYSLQDLINLSSGKGTTAVSAKVDFFWYAFKGIETKPAEGKSSLLLKNITGKVATTEEKDATQTNP